MTEGNYVVPVGVEKPVPIMFWEPLEFVLATTLVGFGIITGVWVLGFAGAGGILIVSRYLRRGAKRGVMQHFLWSLGLPMDAPLSKFFPPPERNDFFE